MLIARDHMYTIMSHIKKKIVHAKNLHGGVRGGAGAKNGYFEQNEHFHVIK